MVSTNVGGIHKCQWYQQMSVTSATCNHHVVVLFQDDVLVVIEVEQADGVEFVGDATRRAHIFHHAQSVNDALNGCVVGWFLVLSQRKRALAGTVISVVAVGRDDPARPADLLKVHEHLVP
jgi:hypothetical protein